MNNNLSIKQIFQWFPCSYFESKRDPDDRKFFPTEFFLNILFRWTGSYQNYIWILQWGATDPPLFYLFLSLLLLFKEEVVLLLRRYILYTGDNIYIVVVQRSTTHNKIIRWGIHISRTYRLFYKSYFCFIDSPHIMVQALKIGGVYYSFSKSE